MKVKLSDILTVANLVSIAGLLLTIHGTTNLSTPTGIIEVTTGRLLDVADGLLARKFHASRFGAILDAVCDKIAVFVLLAGALYFHVAPVAILGLILFQNTLNTVIALYSELKKLHPESSHNGKRAMFLLIISVIAYAAAKIMFWPQISDFLAVVGLITSVLGITIGFAATLGYFRFAIRKAA